MQIQIRHLIEYRYSSPAQLEPHTLRLRPRCDGIQNLLAFDLQVDPLPIGQSPLVDLEGNTTVQVWFGDPTEHLRIQTQATVLTLRQNPFDYLLFDWATHLPIDYPSTLAAQLQPYLGSQPEAAVQTLAWEVWDQVHGDSTAFLQQLNQRIHSECRYILREKGDPWPASLTWHRKTGSCRDLTLLFMEICRTVGLAARFVSGYQVSEPELPEASEESDETESDPVPTQSLAHSHLHAWAEVYLPGAGWRGFDPTQGLAVAEQHIALAASPHPSGATPISGHWLGRGIQSSMHYSIALSTSVQSQTQFPAGCPLRLT
ncbi:transglutaminase family protein [Synechococcus sp. Nb3U1]|uniref:transglutaminase family protein n=1 Tax=Synechococcus sp. Nb3U1 TaxID=1914529 RepID=UPI001F48F449|nr:transglutaminase family protein [Synechococcus sp. Nb3U1]MCF2972682.1 transglutaminase family protein [Synechococcus sp. Nb3U1]